MPGPLYHIYFWTLTAALVISMVSFWKKYPWHLRWMSIFLAVTVATEKASDYTDLFKGICGVRTNIPVYNLFMLLEYLFYGVYFWAIIRSPSIKKWIVVFLLAYPVHWAYANFFIFDICHWNSRATIVGDFAVILLCALYFRQIFQSEHLVDLKTCPEFWINSGVFIFSCCKTPITGLFNYLGEHYAILFSKFDLILDILNIIMYVFILYAFLCPLLTRITKSWWQSRWGS